MASARHPASVCDVVVSAIFPPLLLVLARSMPSRRSTGDALVLGATYARACLIREAYQPDELGGGSANRIPQPVATALLWQAFVAKLAQMT